MDKKAKQAIAVELPQFVRTLQKQPLWQIK